MTKARDLSKLLSTSNGKIAGSNLDVSFENISDTGTTGTKVASGTTAQRGSTTGQWRYNSTTGKFEGRGASDFVTIEIPPTVSSVNVSNITQAQIDANFDLVITGTNFQSGDVVKFIGNDATEYTSPTVTINSSTQITARITSDIDATKEPYKVQVTSSGGLSGLLSSAFNIDASPVWQTASGSLGNVLNGARSSVSFSATATDSESDTIAYSVQSGSLPSGLSLNTSTGAITGSTSAVGSDTTSNFTLRATSGTNTTDRAFSITLQAPVTQVFSYTGSNQTFTVPSGLGSFQVYMWGAGGLGGSSNPGRNGGKGGAGGYVAGTISNYSAGQTFSILVGQGTQTASGSGAISSYGGGGSGCDNNNQTQGIGGHGGGRSEISIGGGSNTPSGTRILVAGGGAGGGAYYGTGEPNNNTDGGDAGYTSGQSGNGTGTVATGGTQSAGGTKGSGANGGGNAPINGSAGVGGYARGGNQDIDIGYGRPGGGGGGYYGGGGGDGGSPSHSAQGGGGGSSYYNSSYVSNFAHATGSQQTAPENSNTYYASGIAVGGAGTQNNSRNASIGGNGRIVLVY